MSGVEVGGHKVLRAKSSVVPNAIAALLLHLRDTTGRRPTATSAGPRATPSCTCCVFFSSGRATQLPSPTRSREAEPDARRRPVIHVGGR